jgi:hypothetical protein
MLIVDATVGRSGKQIQFVGNGIKIVGPIPKPTSYQFMRLNLSRNSQLFIPLQNGSTSNVTTYRTVNTIRSNPNPLIATVSYPSINLPLITFPCPIITNSKFYYLFTSNSMPVESRLANCNLQCIGKRPIGNIYQYAFYKY